MTAVIWLEFSFWAAMVAVAGHRLSLNGDVIAEKTGLSGNWIGLALLATVTSLPELVTGVGSITAAGAPDMAVGDAVLAWGFGPSDAVPDSIRAAMSVRRVPAHEALEVSDGKVTKRAAVTLDLNGIAKGFGVDRLAETVARLGVADVLVGIDGEMRAMGTRTDGQPWSVAVETPDPERRAPHSILSLSDCAVATSGDYRHSVEVRGRRLSHTIDPHRGAPLLESPASVTVVAPSCAAADAWATALMVLSPQEGSALARKAGVDALFLLRVEDATFRTQHVGRTFEQTT